MNESKKNIISAIIAIIFFASSGIFASFFTTTNEPTFLTYAIFFFGIGQILIQFIKE